jgi:hypothetical protein
MMFALLMLIAAQTQPPKPQEAAQPVSAPAAATTLPTAPVPAPQSASATVEAAPPEPEEEPEAALPTRQVCRYVAVTGQRFPVRTCRTVTVYPDEGQ